MLAGLAAMVSCNKNESPELDLKPSVICHQAISGTAMNGEKIVVSASNISSSTEVTVKFGKEQTLTRKGAGTISYAFEKPGSKTITVTMSPEEVEKQTFKVYIEKLDALQVLAQKLKANPKLCLTMAHRGNSSDWSIPENSLGAIEKCVADKVDIMETDLYTTKDGVLVVSHDPSLSRETDGSGNISSKTLSKIKSLHLKDRNGNVTDYQMLTFDELLDACKGRIYVNVDIGDRDADIPTVVTMIEKKGMTEQVLVYCNDKTKIQAAFKTNPNCNVYSPTGGSSTSLVEAGLPGNIYFTQCTWNPTTAEASRTGKVDSGKQPTSASAVATAVANGTIITVNAIYTLNTAQFWPKDFKREQVVDIFKTFPATQCLHVDTPAEARNALLAEGYALLNN